MNQEVEMNDESSAPNENSQFSDAGASASSQNKRKRNNKNRNKNRGGANAPMEESKEGSGARRGGYGGPAAGGNAQQPQYQ